MKSYYLYTAAKFSNEMFATTLSVRATISGRAPIVVDKKHVLLIDRYIFFRLEFVAVVQIKVVVVNVF